MSLTLKQEKFCQLYIELGNASEAYRQSYDTDNMKSDTIHRKAAELMADGKITARIDELKAEHQQRHQLTVDDLIRELDQAREIALAKENPNAMITATMGKAKLLGFDKGEAEKVKVEISPLPRLIDLFEDSEEKPETQYEH